MLEPTGMSLFPSILKNGGNRGVATDSISAKVDN